MAEGVPRERRATTCRCNGSERRPADPTVDLQKQITVLADAISRMGVLLSTSTKQVVDDENIRASQQQFVRGCEQRRDDRGYSPRYVQRRRHKRHGHARGRCYDCGKFGHFRIECTRFRKQSYEQERGSRYQGNVQETRYTGGAMSHLHGGCTTGSRSDDTTTIGHSLATRRPPTMCESARADRNYPITKRLLAYQQGAHVQYDVQRDSKLDLEKRRRRATLESRSEESCAVSQSAPRHPSTGKRHSPIRTSVSRHTQTPTSQSELPIVSVSPHYNQDKPHTVATETSHDNAVKHDIIGVNGGHKISDEGPKTASPMLPRKAVEVNLETDPNIETKVGQSYTQDVDWVRTYGKRLREADELDTQQRIAGVKRKASQYVNVTDCTLSIGDCVHIWVRTWTGKIQYLWSSMINIVVCVPCVGSHVNVVRPATGGPTKTLNRVALLPARPPATYVDDYAQEDSLPCDDAILIVSGIDTVADLSGIDEAVPTISVDDVTIHRRLSSTTAGVPPDMYCCEQLTLTESRPTLTRDYFCVIA